MGINAGSGDGHEGAGSAEAKVETVAYETYQKALDQRKADQARTRELQAQLDAFKSQQTEAEQTRLAEQSEFKKLYETEKAERTKLADNLKTVTTAQVESRKKEALKAELGGVRKDDYLKFADLGMIQVNDDGSVDMDSVKLTANRFRESFPELVASKQTSKLPHEAAGGFQPPPKKSLSEMSSMELRAEYVRTQKK